MKKLAAMLIAASLLSACNAADTANINADFAQDFPEPLAVATVPKEEEPENKTLSTEPDKQNDTESGAPEVEDDSDNGIFGAIVGEHDDGLWIETFVFPDRASANYCIYNNTDSEITFGSKEDYRLQREGTDGWEDIEFPDRPMTLELVTLPPRMWYSVHVDWKELCGKLNEGNYRLIKSVNDGGESPIELAGEFTVEYDMSDGLMVNEVDGITLECIGALVGSGMTYSVRNESEYTVTTDNAYSYFIEKFDGEKWQRLEDRTEYVVPADAIVILPGESFEAKVDWSERYGELEAGEYRLIKWISVPMQDGAPDAEFYIAFEWMIANPC